MKTKLLRMARKLWSSEIVPREINRLNQIKWARAVNRLGERWLLAQHIERKSSCQ